jgi:hypothetical protein
MWALPGRNRFSDPGHRRFALAHSTGEQPVAVVVSENPDGPYWGWLGAGDEHPCMIYGHPSLFRMCFPYGPQAEVNAGKGRIVRLDIALADDAS